jgi:hypothetical protein
MAQNKNNTQFTDLKNILNEYHNTFITDRDDPVSSISYFPEMKSTFNSAPANIQYTAPTGSVYWNIENFNKFIMSCFNYNISSSESSVYGQFKIKSGTTANLPELKDIRYHINTINVIIDILEAYKTFIELESVNFKALINNVNNIQLVNKFCRPNKTATFNNLPNVGYIHKATGDSTLVLSISSFEKDNHAFTPVNDSHTVVTDISQFISGDALKAPLTDYLKQTIQYNATENKVTANGSSIEMSYNPHTTSTNEENGQARDKRVINNLLYFLARMSKDNIRLQVSALYYYYKLARAYIYMHCATINLSINALCGSDSDNIIIKLVENSTVILPTSATYLSGFLNESSYTTTSTGATNMTNYNTVLVWVKRELQQISEDLFRIDALLDPALRYILDKSITFTHTHSSANSITLNLNFTDSPFATNLRSIIRNSVTNELFKKNMILVYEGTMYEISGTSQGSNASDNYITINAKYKDYTDQSASSIPSIPFNYTANSSSTLTNCKILTKGIYTLKRQYASNKTSLRGLNENIKFNTVKINNQKNLFDMQKNQYEVLNTQILAYNIILGAVLITFLCLFAFNIGMETKKLISFIICSIIIIIILVYYILSVSYTEESFTIKENFATISSTHGLCPSIDTTYTADKMNYLNEQLLSICTDVMASFQRILGVLPLKDTTDFYNELNNIIELEKDEKININDILTYKRSLGNSNIDIMKYEIHNMKIYIFVILVTAAIYSLLYLVSLFIPSDYGSLLMFVALIVGIIMLSYYIIFTHYIVKTKSMHKYWGPVHNDKF